MKNTPTFFRKNNLDRSFRTTFTSENTLPPDRNRYLVLYLNFSGIVGELHNYRKRLDAHCGTTFENFCKIYADYLPQDTVDELIEIIKP